MADVQDVARFSPALPSGKTTWDRGGLMTNLRLQKPLYFAQGWHLAPLWAAPVRRFY